MTASVDGDDYDDEASLRILNPATILIVDLQGFIVDIDDIQAHGMCGPETDEYFASIRLTNSRRWCSRYH